MKDTPNADRLINERLGEMSALYQVAYYEKVGQHGNFSPTSNFKAALRDAEEFNADPERNDPEVWYIGVEASGADEFAIVKMTKEYFRYVKSLGGRGFSDPAVEKLWMNAAKKALSTGKTVVSSF